MSKRDLEPYRQNLQYKQAFEDLGLNLAEVFQFTPMDLDLENRRLENLLNFTLKYQQYGSQELMELEEGRFCFPPIFPGISPESDWHRFELWLLNQPTRKTISEQLPQTFKIKNPDEIPDAEIDQELEKLLVAVDQAGYGIALCEGVPARLVYKAVLEWVGEEFELTGPAGSGGWVFDGCSGYCPGCMQRPWCSSGQENCWTEDEEAGKMVLIDELEPYVSASPQSLAILQESQAEKDAYMAKFMEEHKNSGVDEIGDFEEDGEHWKVKLN